MLDDSAHAQSPVAVLTSEDRDSWTTGREELETMVANTEPLKMIDSALFVLCLDGEEPETPEEVTKVFLHGDGKNRYAPPNRIQTHRNVLTVETIRKELYKQCIRWELR